MKTAKINIKGFTLIELIVVFGILAMMSVALLATLNPLSQIQKANDSKRKSDLAQIQRALETYYQDNDGYPLSTSGYQIPSHAWGTSWNPYMNLLPKDPNASYKYAYYSSDGQSYYLYASLDRGSKDPQACESLNANLECSAKPFATVKACGGACNYGVTSPNKSP